MTEFIFRFVWIFSCINVQVPLRAHNFVYIGIFVLFDCSYNYPVRFSDELGDDNRQIMDREDDRSARH